MRFYLVFEMENSLESHGLDVIKYYAWSAVVNRLKQGFAEKTEFTLKRIVDENGNVLNIDVSTK